MTQPLLEYDSEGVRRVARVLLRHVRPQSRNEAHAVLDGRLGVYATNQAILRAEIDKYFGAVKDRAA